ncbi:hypothetical protein [Flavobacterium sp. WG21]|uniref:hypothetical protein n=1 Tax=Flavobacterium sp. WG21 TaxID=1229487 RepID=UPI00036D0F24|nr:hypothetical protein [Flavobacterium sp. WG21]
MNQAPFAIGNFLKHNTGRVIQLQRYATQVSPVLRQSLNVPNQKIIPNYRYLYGIDIASKEIFKGYTKDFELVNL